MKENNMLTLLYFIAAGWETMELYQLVADHRQLIQHFNRREYPAYFQKYRENVALTIAKITDVSAKVNNLADAMERDWKAEKFWKRSALRDGDRMIISAFLTPAFPNLDRAKDC